MSETEKKKYESPSTRKTQVEMEENFLASSGDRVVKDDKNTKVDIDRQEAGGEFEINTWNQ